MIKQAADSSREAFYDDFPGDAVIEIKNLSRKFGRKQALDDVSMEIPRGVVMGLVGLNGAGKTTLLKHILGLLRAQQGSVSVFGKDPSRHPKYVLSRMGYLTEEDSLPGWMKVWQILRFSKPFYPNWNDQYAQELLETFKIDPAKTIKKMSKGQRARVGLTIALAHRPELLVLDEPSSGLDPVVRNDILAAIIRTIADSGRTVLFSSHLLDEVQRVSDMIGVIRNGKLVECGPLENLQTRYQRVTLTVDDSSEPPKMEAMGKWEQSGDQWSAILDIAGEDLEQAVASIGGKIVKAQGVSLNDWFLDTSRE
jgi:ABC-2 type transport system ATP-binding protein